MDATEPTPPPRRRPWWRHPAIVAFAAAPVVYGALVALQPRDSFDAWHSDIAWPARRFLTDGTPGFVLPLFAFLMVGGIGSLVAAAVVHGVARLLGRILRVPSIADWLGAAVLVAMPVWAFAWVKAVPMTVTVIAKDPVRLEVHRFGPVTRLPGRRETIGREDVIALDLFTGWEGRSRTLSLKVGAVTRAGAGIVLGARECEGKQIEADVAACLQSGEPDLLELARALDLTPTGPVDAATRRGHRLLRVAPTPP